MKKIIVITILLVLIVFLLTNYLAYRNQEVIGKKNLRNLEMVQRGMDSIEVKTIMGEPYERYRGPVHNELQLDYQVPQGNSYEIVIVFDLNGKVQTIYPNMQTLKPINENYQSDN